jgi:hypothetical protein
MDDLRAACARVAAAASHVRIQEDVIAVYGAGLALAPPMTARGVSTPSGSPPSG